MDDPDPPRAKLLISFGGSILSRPIDGRLRYVGGETRIISLPRDVTYEALLSRMRELYSACHIIKYQQPDEDLDALVSVVNNDDVINMMDEYEKLILTSSDLGFARLRIFLFSNNHSNDPDAAAAQFELDERENERRYIDALNSVADLDNIDGSGSSGYFSSARNIVDFDGKQESGTGFPGNLAHGHHMFDGSCDHCGKMGFVRNQYVVGGGNEYVGHYNGSCSECFRSREPTPRFYNEAHGHGHEYGWNIQGMPPIHDVRVHQPFRHGNFYEGHVHGHLPDYGGEMFVGQQVVGHGNHIPQYGIESMYQVPPNIPPIPNIRRMVQVPMSPNGYVRGGSPSPRIPPTVLDERNQGAWFGQNGSMNQNLNMNSNIITKEEAGKVKEDGKVDSNANVDNEGEGLTYLPELIASVKKAALESAQEIKAMAEENPEQKMEETPEVDAGICQAEVEAEVDGDVQEMSEIEPTAAEAEAFAKGLQTIKNEDVEEIRELGSGSYGSVYHGKWKGVDVAIKRIKASCFTAKPSERGRLIADFWKEALTMSSLHHPNVVAFYGVVRDGPDGSLATVTEFMVNGSLKQFLQKKDRTIDRRKRVIIALDAASGMEYVHGRNIVHFDLKCENLLVNMRDPQRPICKIGDLGLSKVKQRTLVSGGVRGTLPWMAPELLSGKNMVTEKVDVYSFGIVMWELLTGEQPYGDMHCGSILGGIMNNTLRPQIPTWCDPEWKALMESCWAADPNERPSFAEISQKLRKMAAAMNVK